MQDNYDIYYADKLWSLLPEIYRAGDSDKVDGTGPLRELVNRFGQEAAILRRSIDGLWQDAFIETCDDWLVPYMAGLLGTNLVASLDARGQRLDVAKTIYYRRRKGTVPVLEEIAADITGWDAHVVEFFRRLTRSRHGLDPAIGLPEGGVWPDALQRAEGIVARYSRTAMGGYADLRSFRNGPNTYAPSRAGTAFAEYSCTPDMRRGQGRAGWFNIPRLGVFVWRRRSYGVDYTTPVAVAGCADWFTFDPTGRDIPLHCEPSRSKARSFGTPAEEWQMPGAIDQPLWQAFADVLYSTSPDNLQSVGVFRIPGLGGPVLVPVANVKLWPERGRFQAQNGPLFGVYHYGFSSDIGAGPYDRLQWMSADPPAPEFPEQTGGGLLNVPGTTGKVTLGDSLTYGAPAVPNVLALGIFGKNEKRPVIRMTPGSEWRFTGQTGATLTLDGLLVSGADIVLAGEFDTVTLRSMTADPGSAGTAPAIFAQSADGRTLSPSRVWIEGQVGNLIVDRSICGPVRARSGGVLQVLRCTDSLMQGLRHAAFGAFSASEIFDVFGLALDLQQGATPLTSQVRGLLAAADQTALGNWDGISALPAGLAGAIVTVLNGIVAGANFFDAARFAQIHLSPATIALKNSNPTGAALQKLNRLLLEEGFAHRLAHAAIALDETEVHLDRVTVLGRIYAHRLHASEAILDDVAVVEDTQRGCVRFSAWTTGSILPRKYESVSVAPQAPLFTSRVFGNPGYGQLLENADQAVQAPAGASIAEGAQNGSEMGAFQMEKNAIKERSLRVKFDEFMPIGLSPVIIHVT